MGDLQQNFSVYQFGQEKWRVENDTAAVRPMAKSKKVYRRVMRMKPSGVASTSGVTTSNDQTSNAENLNRSNNEKLAASDDQLPQDDELVVCKDGDYTTAVSGQTGVTTDLKAFSPAPSDRSSTTSNDFSTEQLQEKLNLLMQEEQQLAKELIDQHESYSTLKASAQTLQLQVDNFNKVMENVDPNVIDTLKELLSERDEIKANESAFKKECRSHIEQLDQQINQLRKKEENLEDGAEQEESPDTENRTEQAMLQVTNQLNELMTGMNELNRQIFQLERQVESRPSQIELNQYQRRFVELYNQMSSKHRETKRQYTLYNTLLDVRNFIKREIDLLNSIDDSKDLALKESYKDSFVENLQKICRSVEESLDKILCRKRGLQEQRDALSDNLQLLVDKQRLYMKTVLDFQMECQKNEQLRQNIESNE
uniref:Coiled-coil domain-containing protein 93 n=1 Tax=Ditylenchus dipsaci TaxID=166011 RepID=A0A915EQQ3_9BILA